MNTANAVDRYLRCVRRLEVEPPALRRGELPSLDLTWNQPAVDRGGRTHWLELSWQPWMPPVAYMMNLLDCIEDAAHRKPRGRSLESLNRELAEILCRGPEGVDFMWRMIDEDSADRSVPPR